LFESIFQKINTMSSAYVKEISISCKASSSIKHRVCIHGAEAGVSGYQHGLLKGYQNIAFHTPFPTRIAETPRSARAKFNSIFAELGLKCSVNICYV
jgi:hypothetical protein